MSEKSRFEGLKVEAYKLMLVSFDDDYYYGQVYREYANGAKNPLKEFLFNVELDLDILLVIISGNLFVDRAVYKDFKLDPADYLKQEMLSEAIERTFDKYDVAMIERVMKEDGCTYTKNLI